MNGRSKSCSLRVVVSETVMADTPVTAKTVGTADAADPAARPTRRHIDTADDIGKFKQIK